MRKILIFVACGLLWACSSGSVDGDVDAGHDAVSDAGQDAKQDAGVDAGQEDAGGDDAGGVDAGLDAGGDEGPSMVARDLFDDQHFVIPDNAEGGDRVGTVLLYPTLEDPAASFSLMGEHLDLFVLDAESGILSVAEGAELSPGTLVLRVRVEDGVFDEADMYVQVVDSAQVTFVDPDNSADPEEDGSRAHPFDSWSDVSWSQGRVCLQKRGTVHESQETLSCGASNITLGAYGQGERPVIRNLASGNVHAVSSYGKSGVTVRDLELSAPSGVSCMYFNGGNSDGLVDHCLLQGATWGLRITGGNSCHRIRYTEVHDIGDDGMFIQDASDIVVHACHVHHVNTHWEPPETPQSEAGGDGVQFSRVDGFSVRHSRIDRTNSGNKFCIIANGSLSGLIEHNDLAGPLSTSEGGATLYFGSDGFVTEDVLVRHNRFHRAGAESVVGAIYSHATGLKIHGNVFEDVPKALFCKTDQACEVYHNVFYGLDEALSDGHLVVRNNIFAFGSEGDHAFGSSDSLTEDHNLFSSGEAGPDSLLGEALFVDADAGDFRLQEGSPGIDVGADLGLEQDRDGTSIPQGSAPDLGAYEFVPE